MKAKEFREELQKIMPGYKWTVHKNRYIAARMLLRATGIQSSGFNRIFTLQVERRDVKTVVEYEVKVAGYGTHSAWVETNTDKTLARALRGLQDNCETMARKYGNAATMLQSARLKNIGTLPYFLIPRNERC